MLDTRNHRDPHTCLYDTNLSSVFEHQVSKMRPPTTIEPPLLRACLFVRSRINTKAVNKCYRNTKGASNERSNSHSLRSTHIYMNNLESTDTELESIDAGMMPESWKHQQNKKETERSAWIKRKWIVLNSMWMSFRSSFLNWKLWADFSIFKKNASSEIPARNIRPHIAVYLTQ